MIIGNWCVQIGLSAFVKGSDNFDPTVIGNEYNNDISHINCRRKGICDEGLSQMESDPTFVGPHREQIHDSTNKSKWKKTINGKKTKWQRVKLIARKSVRQLVKEKEKVVTTAKV